MGLLDIILFPVYVLLFHLYFSIARKKMADPQLRFYHKYAFWVKIIGSLAITIFNVYISLGDSTTLYYREGYGLYKLILNDSDHLKWFFTPVIDFDQNLITDPANTGYYKSEANFFIIKMVAFFSLFCLGKYTIINLFFSMLAFSGIWKLFLFFYERYPKYHKKMAIAVLFLPTLVFWSSGALKDPVCMCMLGWLTFSVYDGFYKKRNMLANSVVAMIAMLVISIVIALLSFKNFFKSKLSAIFYFVPHFSEPSLDQKYIDQNFYFSIHCAGICNRIVCSFRKITGRNGKFGTR